VRSADTVSHDAAQAIAQASTAPGRIATLILPADAAWNETSAPLAAIAAPLPRPPVLQPHVRAAAAAIRSGQRATLMLSGVALRADALEVAGRIAKATGVRLLAQQSNARMERGAGRVAIERVPYPVDQALAMLRDVEQLIAVGAKPPVGFFAYPGKPSSMLPPTCQVLQLADPGDDLLGALRWLADELGVGAGVKPDVMELQRPALPTGALTAAAIATAVAALMPDQSIICDESVSSGRNLFQFTRTVPQHDYLQVTGGAIGLGMPMATGAAIACPGRKVINLEADGSGMYTLQALWTQAREQLDVITIVFANRTYAILRGELRGVGAGEPGVNARRMLDIDQPALDWTHLAAGMGVECGRATTAESLCGLLRAALARKGPFLIEAVL